MSLSWSEVWGRSNSEKRLSHVSLFGFDLRAGSGDWERMAVILAPVNCRLTLIVFYNTFE